MENLAKISHHHVSVRADFAVGWKFENNNKKDISGKAEGGSDRPTDESHLAASTEWTVQLLGQDGRRGLGAFSVSVG